MRRSLKEDMIKCLLSRIWAASAAAGVCRTGGDVPRAKGWPLLELGRYSIAVAHEFIANKIKKIER